MAEKNGIEILFEDESLQDLSEDFKTKATVIFETAVAKSVSEERKAIKEEFEEKLEESKKEIEVALEEQVDSYLSYAADEWMEENKLSVDNGIKTEIAEHFMAGMKELFEESYVEIPENKVDVVSEMAEQLEENESELNEAITKNIELENKLQTHIKSTIVSEETKDLADSEVDMIESFIEMVDFEDEDNYRSQVKSIIEVYTGKVNEEDEDEDDESSDSDDSDDSGDDDDKKKKKKGKNPFQKESVNIYANAISNGVNQF